MSSMTSADSKDIAAAVTEMVAAGLGVDPRRLAPDTDLRNVEGADSVKVLRVISRIEVSYGVDLDDEDVFAATRVDELVAIVEKALRQAQTEGTPGFTMEIPEEGQP